MQENQSYILRLYEYQTIRIGQLSNGVAFSEELFQILAKYHERHQGKYYSLIYKGIRLKQYVGVIQVGKYTLEILPKADNLEESPKKWQSVLLDMLQYCQLIKLNSAGIGQLRLRQSPILLIYIESFLKRLQLLINRGLPKLYLPIEQNLKVVKGQIQLPKQLRKNSTHPNQFYVKSYHYSDDHLFNQALSKALNELDKIKLPSHLFHLQKQLKNQLPTAKSQAISERDFKTLSSIRRYKPYQYLLEIAKLIIINYSPDIRSGRYALLAILFDMNLLFEEYVYQQLKKLGNTEIRITRQRPKPFWQRRYIRPDILIEYKGKNYVLDTKWKVLRTATPSIEDLKQLYIYCQYFDAERGILLYPKVFPIENIETTPFHPTQFSKDPINIQVVFLNILNDRGELNTCLGEELINTIVKN